MLPLLLAELDKYYNGLFSAAEAHSVMIIQNLKISYSPYFLSLPFSHLPFQNGQYPDPEQPKRWYILLGYELIQLVKRICGASEM